jgi:biopolymer transport protein ExbB
VAALAVLAFAQPLLAQDTQSINAFKMFFWADDIPGLIMIWLLIVMSIVTVALVIQHLMANKANEIIPKQNLAEYEAMLADKRFRDAIEKAAGDPSMMGKMLHASLAEAPNGYGAMERAIEEVGDLEASRRSRRLELLNVMGATGPMIGLFGTVYGMIAAFYQIVEAGGQPQPGDLAGGIATALVTTLWGLVVGIPAVAAVSLIRAKIDSLTVEAMVQTETLIGQFSPAKRASGAPGAPGTPAGAASSPPPPPVTSAATPRPRPA